MNQNPLLHAAENPSHFIPNMLRQTSSSTFNKAMPSKPDNMKRGSSGMKSNNNNIYHIEPPAGDNEEVDRTRSSGSLPKKDYIKLLKVKQIDHMKFLQGLNDNAFNGKLVIRKKERYSKKRKARRVASKDSATAGYKRKEANKNSKTNYPCRGLYITKDKSPILNTFKSPPTGIEIGPESLRQVI
jgi:hypothetical protein